MKQPKRKNCLSMDANKQTQVRFRANLDAGFASDKRWFNIQANCTDSIICSLKIGTVFHAV